MRAAGDASTKAAVGQQLQPVMDSFYAYNPDFHAKVSNASREIASFNHRITMMGAMLTVVGVRMALGACQRGIRTQFIAEAIIVCLVGGITGIVIGQVQPVVATPACFRDCSASPKTSAGVFQPRVLRGLLLRVWATA
ncbi:ABC transporter permease, partial [Corynebacterium liangguodongii]|uniref:ABC transporter permease n=1 Tax=Corynebacterium liangguodongii TaxID=2079535 RepID=UPI0039A0AED1